MQKFKLPALGLGSATAVVIVIVIVMVIGVGVGVGVGAQAQARKPNAKQNSEIQSGARSAPGNGYDVSFRPVSSLNLNSFPFDQKEVFRSVIETRLSALDRGTRDLQARAAASGNELAQERVSNLQSRFEIALNRLQQLETVEAHEWGRYRRTLRDETAALEDAYNQLDVAIR